MHLRRPSLHAACLLTLLGLTALVGVAAAQRSPIVTPRIGMLSRVVFTFIFHLVVGGILVAVIPEETRTAVARIRREPLAAFGWGFGAFLLTFVAMGILAITIIGLLVVIPGAIALVVVLLVGDAFGTIALGMALARVDPDANLWYGLGIGALVVALLTAIPFLGWLVSFVVGMIGFGSIVRGYWRSRDEESLGAKYV